MGKEEAPHLNLVLVSGLARVERVMLPVETVLNIKENSRRSKIRNACSARKTGAAT